MIPITCEINFPVNGINRRIGGAFLTDSTGDIFVAHRGKIGGGKKGIGKSLFEDQYRGRWEIVEDNGFETEVALISALKLPRFVNQVRQLVFEVNRITKGLEGRCFSGCKTYLFLSIFSMVSIIIKMKEELLILPFLQAPSPNLPPCFFSALGWRGYLVLGESGYLRRRENFKGEAGSLNREYIRTDSDTCGNAPN